MKTLGLCSVLALATTGLVVACGDDLTLLQPGADAGPTNKLPDAGLPQTTPRTEADAGPTVPEVTYAIGGKVVGLSGTGLVLQNNAGDDLPIAADGSFTFPTKHPSGAMFSVAIKTHPTAPSQTCSVSGGQGAVGKGNVSSVLVNCSTNAYAISGNVSGLAGTGLVVQVNGGTDLPVTATGTFAFGAPLPSGTHYAITVKSHPSGPTQSCEVTNPEGDVTSAAVTNVAITCTTTPFKVGGSITGLAGSGLKLKLGDGAPVDVSGAAFQFAADVPSGAPYKVTIAGQPSNPTQTCTIAGDEGTVGAGNVTSVAVNCKTDAFALGGSASGVRGKLLLHNGADEIEVNGDGTFAFTPVASGADYDVKVKQNPATPSQTCTVTNGAGRVADAPIANVAVACVTNKFKVKLAVSGLAGKGLVLQNDKGADLAIDKDGDYEFADVESGKLYDVAVKTQPSELTQQCVVTKGTGTVGGADVTDVTVACTTSSFLVSGTIAGLAGDGLVLRNAGEDAVIDKANGTFAFPSNVLSGGSFAITIPTQPTTPSQSCTVTPASGSVTNGNVTGITVNCDTNKFTVSGKATGLKGTGLRVTSSLGEATVNNDGTYAFPTTALSGSTVTAIGVKTQPTNPSQTCTAASATAAVGNGPLTNVDFACTTNTFDVKAAVTGLTGTLVLANGTDELTFTANGTKAFASKVASGASYAVQVKTPPPGQSCTVTGGAGTMGAAEVTATVECRSGLMIKVEGRADVFVPCAPGAYSCQAHYVCNVVTNTECVHQDYDCFTGYSGSWYPPISGAGGSDFNFAYAYDFGDGFSNYGNICACNGSMMTRFGLAATHQYCGTGHWTRQ